MTDIDKVKSLLDELKIGYSIEEEVDTTLIMLTADKDNLVTGYYGFYAYFSFHTDSGSFEKVGIYE